jgi:uncharacterized protein DUF4272
MEPINIFSHKQDLAGVATLLRQLAPNAKVVGTESNWERITIEGAKSWFRKAPSLTFKHAPDYYRGPDWPKQVAGMQAFFGGFPDVPRKPDILRLIGSFQFALATEFEPDLSLDSDDARLKFLFAVAKQLDGVLFTPSGLRDAAGRVLISADGESDPAAILPSMPTEPASAPAPKAQSAAAPTTPAPATQPPDAPKKPAKKAAAPKPPPPPPAPVVEETPPLEAKRVARRALCLAAIGGRGLLDADEMPREKAEAHQKAILTWASELALEEELEPNELKLIQQSVGTLERQPAIDAVWRFEGLGVLAWALGRFELPAYDQLVDPTALLTAVGFLDLNKSTALLASPALRRLEELRRLQQKCFAVHWRLQEFLLKKKKMNFRTFARDCWFGPLDVSLVRFHDHDLAIGKLAISNAPPEEVNKTFSAIRERHLASNWLVDGGKVYSETDTST